MSTTVKTVKIAKAYNCLSNFKDNCNDKECKKFVDIFFPMIYKNNKHRLEISVGKIFECNSKTSFNTFLSMITHNFMVGISQYNNEPQFIIYDQTIAHIKKTVALINLALIKNLKIEEENNEDLNFCKYNILFNYNNEIDYNIMIEVN